MNYDTLSFRKIDNLAQYVENGIASGTFKVETYVKAARIRAVPGTPGEKIETILQNGLKETVNTVGIDPETGSPDWIVTAPDGEKYIVTDRVFWEKYHPAQDEEGVFLPNGKPVEAVQVTENVRFTAPWGEEQFLLAEGSLILDPGGIYGVACEEFRKTYEKKM